MWKKCPRFYGKFFYVEEVWGILCEYNSEVEVEQGLTSQQTLSVISGTGFYGANDPTNSVKALKEERS